MNIQHNVSLKDYCTLKIGGTAAHLVHVTTRQELSDACQWAKDNEVGVFVLGEGSNLVFSDAPLNLLVLRIEIPGFETVEETDEFVTVRVGAGEHWDSVVERTVTAGLSGLESLSMIPGTAGATPVQNVGAYGHEVGEAITEVEVFDINKGSFETLPKAQCGFDYRTSIFKTTARGKYIICSVTFKLAKTTQGHAEYASLARWMDEHQINNPTTAQVREGVMAIRSIRLPDPSVVPNVGSFFGNPIVDQATAQKLLDQYSEMPSFAAGDKIKLQAGWLIEQCGLKGKELGVIKIYDNNALVLTNPNGGGFADVEQAAETIITTVHDKFGITLEPEPQFIQ
jgi:UDP-N-acetylmuramate dehydrogenase